MKLKTLNDISKKEMEQWEGYHVLKALGRLEQLTRQEAIKWVKEDINTDGGITMATLLWMGRLNITKEDLK